jgi:hypothetical protein
MKIKINKDKIKEFLFKAAWVSAKHAFFACLILFFLAFFLGVLLFLKCNAIIKAEDLGNIQESFSLNRKIYEDIMTARQQDENRYETADSKEYSNPFLKP